MDEHSPGAVYFMHMNTSLQRGLTWDLSDVTRGKSPLELIAARALYDSRHPLIESSSALGAKSQVPSGFGS